MTNPDPCSSRDSYDSWALSWRHAKGTHAPPSIELKDATGRSVWIIRYPRGGQTSRGVVARFNVVRFVTLLLA
jgi:hypothetical protein